MDPVDKGAGRPSQLPEQSRPDGKNYLLAIGIDQYLHQPKLYNAVRDAQKVVEILTTQFQFEKENVTELYDEEATLGSIFNILKIFRKKLTVRDSLVIYFSGHGEYDSDVDQGYWIPYEGKPNENWSFASFDNLIKFIKAIPCFHLFIAADSCFSGSMFVQRSTKGIEKLESFQSRWLLTAGRNEVVSDGKPGTHSPFADSLILHLTQLDKDFITVAKLCEYVTEDVLMNSSQTPRGEPMRDVGHRGGQFVFRRKGFSAPIPGDTRSDEGPEPEGTTKNAAPVAAPVSPPEPATLPEWKVWWKTQFALDPEPAVQTLQQKFNPTSHRYNDLILQLGRFNGLQRDMRNGLISVEQSSLQMNRIRQAMHYLIDEIQPGDIQL